MALKRTPLYNAHVRMGARMVEFGGWEMPVQYPSGIIEEHRATRNHAGLFDISHMGEFIVRGPEALKLLNYATTNDLSRIEPWQAQYNFFAADNGDVKDDTIIFRFPDYYYVVVNGGPTESDYHWLEELSKQYNVELENVSDATAKIDIQGPDAERILQQLTPVDLKPVTFYHFTIGEVAGVGNVIISRTGYTGEDGFELFFPAEHAEHLWQTFIDAGATPVGLGARDTLRMEAGLPLSGADLGDNGRDPISAGFGWAVKLNKDDFVGKAALQQIKEHITRKWVNFEVTGRGVARPHYPVTNQQGEVIGEVASGTYAPTLDKNIGMAWVKLEYAAPGIEINIIIRDKPVAAIVRPRPIYKREKQA